MLIQLLRRIVLLVLLSSASIYSYAQANLEEDSVCGPLKPQGQYGPFDFRTDKSMLPVVVDNHFPLYVEKLIRGKTSVAIGGDIAFTLRAIPNHPNALIAMMLLGEKEKTDQPAGSTYTVECWFERALRFRPDDHIARMIYTSYLIKKTRTAEARTQLAIIAKTTSDNALTLNNVGLLYFDLGDYPQALLYSHKAMSLGFGLRELHDKLKSVGKWEDVPLNTSGAASKEPSQVKQ